MFLTVQGPAGHEETAAIDGQGASLGTILGPKISDIEFCMINGRVLPNWENYIPIRGDRILLRSKTEAWIIPYIIYMIIALALSMIVQALTPKPKKPKMDGRGDAYGIVGFQNTTGQGVPIPVWYGQNRVYPHVIASGVDIAPDGRDMVGRVLYCIGDSGGDGYEAVESVQIDGVPVEQYQGVEVQVRLGLNDQSVIPGFTDVTELWSDNRTVPYDDDTETGTPIDYRTKTDLIDASTLIFSFPSGLWRINSSGHRRADIVSLDVFQKRASQAATSYIRVMPNDGEWVGDPNTFHFEENTQTQLFKKIIVDHSWLFLGAAAAQYWADRPDVKADNYYGYSPIRAKQHYIDYGQFEGSTWHFELEVTKEQVDIRIQVSSAHTGPNDEAHASTILLFNVEERIYGAHNYPGYVLLGLTGIPAKQIKSLQSMTVSALVKGKKVTAPGFASNVYTRARAWNLLDVLTNPICGMGYEVDISEIDLAQWGSEEVYWSELVTSQSGATESRTLADFGVTERRWDWEYIKRIAGEGRGRIYPSGDKWKLRIEKPEDPNLLFAEPGNIIDGSITMEIAPPDKPFNQVIAEFRDETDDYKPNITQPINSAGGILPSVIQEAISYETITRESEAMRENMIVMKRQDLERRRWNFKSPMGAIVSEPLDVDWLSERVLGDAGAYTGILGDGCTTTTLVLPFEIELLAGKTYLAIVQHKDNSQAETRIVSTATGKWLQLTVSSAFAQLPAPGDVFAIGWQDVDHIQTRAQDLTIDEQGRVQQLRTEYIPAVYDPDPLPPGLNRRRFGIVTVPPIPLRDAAVTNQLVQKEDGHWASVVIFDVTPGAISTASINSGVAWPKVWIPVSVLPQQIQGIIAGPFDSFQRYYFRDAFWQLTSGTGAGVDSKRKIVDFDPNPVVVLGVLSYNITLEGTQPLGAITGETCLIEWEKFSDFHGFKLEISATGQQEQSWAEVAKPVGTHYERDGGDQGGTSYYYRFTPYNNSGVENRVARIVKLVTIGGDLTAPPAPLSVLAFATTSLITVEATFALPMALDFAGIEIFVDQYRYVPPFNTKVLEGAVVHTRTDATRENGTSGTVAVRKTVDIRNVFQYPPAPSIWEANVRAYDYSGNKSAWVLSNDFYPQKLSTGDIA